MTTSDLVPRAFPVAIDGTPFMIDTDSYSPSSALFQGPTTIPVLREQSDSSTTPGAGSVNRDDAWRTVFTDWSHGAGQTWYNDPSSDGARFRQSKGVDVWTPGQMSLLTTTSSLLTASTSFSGMAWHANASDANAPKIHVYYFDGASGTGTYKRVLIDSSDTLTGPTSLTAMTTGHTNGGLPNRCVATDYGSNVYFIDGDTKIAYANLGATATSNLATLSIVSAQIHWIAYVKHRLLAYTGPGFQIADCTAGGTIATAAITITATSGALVDASEGNAVIFISGNLDGRAVIYSVTPDPTTTALTNLKQAAVLPFGETIYATFGYSGFLLVGTDKGFRLCAELSDGTLQVGALVNIGKPVRCFTAIGQFVYFGWSNYDGTDGGLGRIDLTTFANPASLIPAYATDIMAASNTNNVVDVIAFDNGAGTVKPYFMTTDKLYRQTSTSLTSGTIDFGFATYEMTDPKCAVGVEVRTQALPSSATVAVSLTNVQGGSPASISTYSTTSGTGTYMAVSNITGSEHEIRLTLGASGSPPVVTATTLFAQVRSATRGEYWQLPVLIGADIVDMNGNPRKFDPFTVIAALRALVASSTPVTVQMGTYSDTMFVEQVDGRMLKWSLATSAPIGTLLVTVKNLAP